MGAAGNGAADGAVGGAGTAVVGTSAIHGAFLLKMKK